MKQTRIDEVAAAQATPPKIHRADEVRPRGSMADVEKAHGTAPADPAAVKAKAAKQRIDPAAYGVQPSDAPEAPAAPAKPDPTARTINGRKGGRKPREPRE